MLYTDKTGALCARPIRFTIEGKEWTDDQLRVAIPPDYANVFEGAYFKSMSRFKYAVKHAQCAVEAKTFGKDWLIEMLETEIQSAIDVRKRRWS